jgi:predicted RNA methylase
MFGDDFYPTPSNLIDKMLEMTDLAKISTVLEPSAGRGDILDRLKEIEHRSYGPAKTYDAIEIDEELSMVLEGKGYKPIARDFLNFHSFRSYDLVIMNPPFSAGDKHLLKAIELQQHGGQILCLLNAETIRNPYTNTRKELVALIAKHGGSVEYVENAFSDAARKTSVEVALVHLDIGRDKPVSEILKNLVEAQQLTDAADANSQDLIEGDYIRGAVRRYELETKAGLKLLAEYEAMKPLLSSSFTDETRPILEISVDGDRYGNNRNKLVQCMRMKYWKELFQAKEFGALFTSKTRGDYEKRIADLGRYEFDISNIKQMQIELSQSMLSSLDESIVRLFDEFSNQYWDEQSNNIHYYNGWKTNKAFIVNKKVITRMQAWEWSGFRPTYHGTTEKLIDIHKVFSYLDGALSNNMDGVYAALQQAEATGRSRAIELPYCRVDFYKKGTAHITFTDERLLKKFNLIGSQSKGWLPPDYGKKAYADMSEDHQTIVDSFEGQQSYADTLINQDFYASRSDVRLALAAGDA